MFAFTLEHAYPAVGWGIVFRMPVNKWRLAARFLRLFVVQFNHAVEIVDRVGMLATS